MVKFYMDTLKLQKTANRAKKALENLPSQLDEIYKEALKRIDDEDALKFFTIVAYSRKPLRLEEIEHAFPMFDGLRKSIKEI